MIDFSNVPQRSSSSLALEQSITTFLEQGGFPQDLWIFGYASLIWFPDIAYVAAHPALLNGYQRTLCIQAKIYRGTPEFPGLVFGLEQGAFCQGKAFLLDSKQHKENLFKLWKREMIADAYLPTWVEVVLPHDQKVPALAFVANQQGSCYLPQPSLSELIHIVSQAKGATGTCYDYVHQTYLTLQQHQIKDHNLELLFQCLKMRQELG